MIKNKVSCGEILFYRIAAGKDNKKTKQLFYFVADDVQH